jgi:hypothetical protein
MLESKNISEYFKSIGYMQSNEEIWREDGRETCGKEYPTLTVKEVPLCGGHNREIIKYGCSFNTRSHRKIASPWGNSQRDSRGCGCISTFFLSKIVLDIAKGVEDKDKAEKKKDDIDIEEEVEATSIGQPINHMKQIGRPVTLIVEIRDPGFTNQKLNAIIIKRQVIMLGIARVQPRGLRRMQILW